MPATDQYPLDGGKKPCVGDLYPVAEVEAATLIALRRAWESPQSVAAALDVYRREPDPVAGEGGEALRAVDDALDALRREQASVVQAQVAGMRAGASPDAYADLFADLAARRKDLAAQRREVEGRARRQADPRPQEAGPEATTEAFREAWAVLSDPDVPGVTKRDILQTLVQRVVCRKGGAEVVFRPGLFGENAGDGGEGTFSTLYTICIGIRTHK